ncbi:MAG: sugar isomerase, partial [bacterium]|nr:sugar isomerase [bacterium]
MSHCCGGDLSRRDLLSASAATGIALTPLQAVAQKSVRGRQQPIRVPLRVQPILVYQIYKRREQRSWRPWGGLMNERDVTAEKARIAAELDKMQGAADFPVEVLPLKTASTVEEASRIARGDYDVGLMYAASAGVQVYEALNATQKWNIMFVRHRSGPVYLWYEVAHPRYLRKTVDEYGERGQDSQDVVVDSHEDVLWRLRGLAGLKNALGKRIVCVGGASGWATGGKQAPANARRVFGFDLVSVSYDELGQRIEAANADSALVKRCHQDADRYLGQQGIQLETKADAVRNAFVLTDIFRDLLDEAATDAITINLCMGTIMPMSKTTACLPLSLLNDDGYMAFCESDFVVIPSGVLLHYVSGKPVFLNDPTYPHHGLVTLAHCTAPRRMDGSQLEPARILTHFESDYGAAPKVEMRKGQTVTNIVPDFAAARWLGFKGEIVDNPFMPICRSQIDVKIQGDCQRLAAEMRG